MALNKSTGCTPCFHSRRLLNSSAPRAMVVSSSSKVAACATVSNRATMRGGGGHATATCSSRLFRVLFLHSLWNFHRVVGGRHFLLQPLKRRSNKASLRVTSESRDKHGTKNKTVPDLLLESLELSIHVDEAFDVHVQLTDCADGAESTAAGIGTENDGGGNSEN